MKLGKKIISSVLALAVGLSFSGCDKSSTDDDISARVYVEGTKLMVNGSEFWVNGVNTPWHHWGGFAGNLDEEFWDKTFAQLAADNINCTRIWVNCCGESVTNIKKTGEIKSVNEGHWTDLDKLFAIAEKHEVYVMPTLLSFDHFKEGNGGYEDYRKMITSKEYSDLFADTYVAEFCKRYAECEYIFAIDLINEPDWVYENEECGKIGWDDLSYFFGKCAAVIHENSDMLVTVGLGMIRYNSDLEKYEGNKISDAYLKELTGNENAYVDFDSVHYYEWERPFMGFPCDKSPIEFGLDGVKPSILGETSNDDEKQTKMTLSEKYRSVHDNGWNGIMVWMTADETGEWYRYDLTQAATNDMNEYIPDKIHPIK